MNFGRILCARSGRQTRLMSTFFRPDLNPNRVILCGTAETEPVTKGSDEHPYTIFKLKTSSEGVQGNEFAQYHRICVFMDRHRKLVDDRVNIGARVYLEGKLRYKTFEDDEGRTIKLTSVVPDGITVLKNRTE